MQGYLLPHVVDDAYDEFVALFVHAHQDRVIHHVDDRQEKGVVQDLKEKR